MKRELQSDRTRTSMPARPAHCSRRSEPSGSSEPIRRSAARMRSRAIPRRAISDSTVLVIGTKLAGISSEVSMGTSSGASSSTSRSPDETSQEELPQYERVRGSLRPERGILAMLPVIPDLSRRNALVDGMMGKVEGQGCLQGYNIFHSAYPDVLLEESSWRRLCLCPLLQDQCNPRARMLAVWPDDRWQHFTQNSAHAPQS